MIDLLLIKIIQHYVNSPFLYLFEQYWQQIKREAANTSNLLIPWELRIKEIESHFGSVVASYFTFLRWLFWVNLVIGFILLVFVIVPEVFYKYWIGFIFHYFNWHLEYL